MQIFSSWEQNELAVVDPENPRKLVGSVHKRDVITLYNEEVMRRDLAGGVSRAVDVVGKVHQVELGDGYVVQEILAPSAFQGHSLRDLKVRDRTGVQVVLIRGLSKGRQAPSIRVPGPADRIEPGDRLVVAGPKEAIDRLDNI
jgi:Trk K+ transport system NAD-binding subunit